MQGKLGSLIVTKKTELFSDPIQMTKIEIRVFTSSNHFQTIQQLFLSL